MKNLGLSSNNKKQKLIENLLEFIEKDCDDNDFWILFLTNPENLDNEKNLKISIKRQLNSMNVSQLRLKLKELNSSFHGNKLDLVSNLCSFMENNRTKEKDYSYWLSYFQKQSSLIEISNHQNNQKIDNNNRLPEILNNENNNFINKENIKIFILKIIDNIIDKCIKDSKLNNLLKEGKKKFLNRT